MIINTKREFSIPENAEYIIKRLERCGFRADIVGGCVRDSLLMRTPYDYDITTSATPDEMKDAFEGLKVLETGIKHGTLTVVIDSVPYEVTSYRVDGEYDDNRHPSCVKFTKNIEEDLARRDFTVNAMAYNKRDGLTDPFGGRDDLSEGIIRAVGDPVRRFSEDALRILRALRFASVLDFEIENKTAEALRALKNNLSDISAERIYTEWKKLLSGKGAHKILSEFSDVVAVFIPELYDYSLPDERLFLNFEWNIRELSLFANGKAPKEAFESAARRLKTDTKHRETGKTVLENFNEPTETKTDIRRMAIRIGADRTADTVALRALLSKTPASSERILKDLIADGACLKISDMKIDGTDLSAMGFRGKEIGMLLSELLSEIAEGILENEREALLAEVKKNFTVPLGEK